MVPNETLYREFTVVSLEGHDYHVLNQVIFKIEEPKYSDIFGLFQSIEIHENMKMKVNISYEPRSR